MKVTWLELLLGGHCQHNVHDVRQMSGKERMPLLEQEQETFQHRRVLVEVFAERQLIHQHRKHLYPKDIAFNFRELQGFQ